MKDARAVQATMGGWPRVQADQTLCSVSRVFWGRRHHIGQHDPFLHKGCKNLCPALPNQLNVSDKAFVMTCPRPFET